MNFTTPSIIELRLAMATQGHQDVRYYLNGIHINFEYGILTATDGSVLSRSPIEFAELDTPPEEIILTIDGTIPKRADRAVFKIIEDTGEVSLFNEDVLIKTLPLKVVDETYPDIDRILEPTGLGYVEVTEICFNVPHLTKISQATGQPFAKLTFSDGGAMGVSLHGLPNTTIRLMPARF